MPDLPLTEYSGWLGGKLEEALKTGDISQLGHVGSALTMLEQYAHHKLAEMKQKPAE